MTFGKVASTTYWDLHADPSWYVTYGSQLTPLLPYLDPVVDQLSADFDYTIFPLPAGQARLYLVLDPASHGGATGTYLGPYGITIAADSVYNYYGSLKSFWFHILSLHETVNVWTGSLASNWVWADGSTLWAGQSPFPNMCDIIVTSELGKPNISSTQASRMGTDPGVQLFLSIRNTYGWGVFQQLFATVHAYNITSWASYAEPLRTAIIIWFLSYPAGASLLNQFNAALTKISNSTVPLATYRQAQTSFPLPKTSQTT